MMESELAPPPSPQSQPPPPDPLTEEAAPLTGEAAPLAVEAAALIVEGEMTVYRAVELKDAMLGALRRSGPVDVDLSRVTEIDSAGVQVLLLGKQVAMARHQELRLTAVSAAVDEVLTLLNLRRHLGVPSPAEAAAAAAPAPDGKATES